MCEVLNLNYDVLAKLNHKDFTLEHFHRFLNKSVAITTEDRGTKDIFVPAGIATGNAWNSAQIDDTNIICSIPAMGQKLHFPIDININALPKLTQNNFQTSLDY